MVWTHTTQAPRSACA
uniref:Uncharacterized protein n=1 Tax=Arundo donax TaxID=35708 RepID=A0A0A9CDF7_ARUDO